MGTVYVSQLRVRRYDYSDEYYNNDDYNDDTNYYATMMSYHVRYVLHYVYFICMFDL